MSQKPTVTSEITLNFLSEKFTSQILQLTLLSGNDWSQAYSFINDRKKYVLRWSSSLESFHKDAFAVRFRSIALPIPQIVEIGEQFDKYFAISEFAQGVFLEKLPDHLLVNTFPSLFSMFDELKNTDISKTSGYGGWDKDGNGNNTSWKEYLLGINVVSKNNLAEGWCANLVNSPQVMDTFNKLYAELTLLVDKCPEARELIHGDLLNSNLLILDNKISAVIDWQCSMYGDSLYEVAWFVYCTQYFPQFETTKLCSKAIEYFRFSSANTDNLDERLLCYQLHIGLGTISYNAFKNNLETAQKESEYTLSILQKAKK